MLGAILAGFIFSIILIFAGRFLKGKLAIISAVVPLGIFLYFLRYIGEIKSGRIITQNYEWVPSLGVNLGFTLDGISLIFALMISGIGFLVFVYSSVYLKGHKYLDRFYGYLGLFMAAMLGVVLSDNVISLFVFWELTSISSFFLIGFNNTDESSRKSAILALAITGLGGVLLLVAALLLGNITGTYSITEMLASRDILLDNPSYILLIFLVFGAAFTKSAQFPFHFWLPGAMKAPTPVSTYLHSATMVKAGIYLLLRFTPILGQQEVWNTTLIIVGGTTMVYAAIITLFKTDLKGILAYSTISALGILVFLIGLGTKDALLAACVFILVHALYKATLFLITGIIDHETHTRNITLLSGLRKVLLPVAIAGFLAAISNAGIPPSFGFIGKDLIYESTLHHGNMGYFLTGIAIFTNALLLYAGFLVGVKPFLGALPEQYEKIHLPSYILWVPPVLLATLGILFGIFPVLVESSLIQPAVKALGVTEAIHIKLWHGFNTILVLSGVTIGLGLLLYFLIKPSEKKENSLLSFERFTPKNLTENFSSMFYDFSKKWTNFFQNGYLRNYIITILLVVIGLLGHLLINQISFKLDINSLSAATIPEVVTIFILLISVIYTISTNSRLAAVAALGIVGLMISMIYVFYSAPDLAMTQFSIDTLTVILFVLVLYKLPKYLDFSYQKNRIWEVIISVAFGGLIALLALQVLQEPHKMDVAKFYAENAYVGAKGKNVVNVIIVDYRGIDTFMESIVLTIAAIGVFSLLKLRLHTKD